MDPKLAVHDRVLIEPRRMHGEGIDHEHMLDFIKAEGLFASSARLALACAGVLPLGEAKRVVHFSRAYSDGLAGREAFETSTFDALAQMDRKDANIAASFALAFPRYQSVN